MVIQARMATEFAGTKKSRSVYNYTNLNTNIVISYLLHKYGEQGFKIFLMTYSRTVLQHEIWLNKNSGAKKNEQSLGHQFFATRYDYLRIAKSMLDEWFSKTRAWGVSIDPPKSYLKKWCAKPEVGGLEPLAMLDFSILPTKA